MLIICKLVLQLGCSVFVYIQDQVLNFVEANNALCGQMCATVTTYDFIIIASCDGFIDTMNISLKTCWDEI